MIHFRVFVFWHKYASSRQKNCPSSHAVQEDGLLQSGRAVHCLDARSSESPAAVQNSVRWVHCVLEFRPQGHASMHHCVSLDSQTSGASSSCCTRTTTKSGEKFHQEVMWRTLAACQEQSPSTSRCSMVPGPKARQCKLWNHYILLLPASVVCWY